MNEAIKKVSIQIAYGHSIYVRPALNRKADPFKLIGIEAYGA